MKKICFITGANAGIGREAAIQIAKKGYHVIIGCRNISRGNEAIKYIKEKSQSEKISLAIVDMSLFASVKACSTYLHEHFDHIDVLIHNAAVFDISQKEAIYTSEGYETVWMTNHIGPVYLTKLLQDLIEKSDEGRIITIASKGLLAMPGLRVNLDDPEFRNRKFSVTKAYYQSKLAQIMFTYWLSNQLKDKQITVNSIRVTAVKVDLNRHPNISKIQRFAYKLKSKKSIEPEKMAETYTRLATNPSSKGITGKYFDEHNQMISSGKYTCDPEEIHKVMKMTFRYVERGIRGVK
ncbi:SDR family NAD(P)-dependent oxidoreductase [Fusibacter ferrireducens]|uniref:SDR family NAD(P)-dependent oxidoreductase n=1 Tax=Fusibacter ferrireducens TaxID=2785058 RepID=A0ABR9ZNY3_9FIRM|nr:SDR family NAD(P)-dependent oxidoreductase [Fusibacter ferrireducens]MBF4692144.1 SDR family NAD(P)-dependent oxidoreductase [Fusibacter ferrireducens]